MLEPNARSLLLDALRPPDGYELDQAIGTTFSLDLNALLTVPLAFAMFDAETSEEGTTPDVVALLEATRRYAKKIHIFGQAGRIKTPANYHRVFSNIESSVHEAVAPAKGGLFHPKTWALRYRGLMEDDCRFRLLVLSRNLTFDQSWDTIVRLDGSHAEPTKLSSTRLTNEPLVTFLKALPDLAVRQFPEVKRREIDELAEDFGNVAFDLPSGFSGLYFDSFGIAQDNRNPFDEGHDRGLVIAPFLGDDLLTDVLSSGSGHVLVSRSESLDGIRQNTLDTFEKVYVMDAAAFGDEDGGPDQGLLGLHAKVYVLEYGKEAHVLSGSANATRAAFNGNVEFVAQLRGRRERAGIEALLGTDSDDATLVDLLVPYSRSNEWTEQANDDSALRSLDDLRHKIAAVGFEVSVSELDSPDEYSLRIRSLKPLPPAADVEASCRPMTLGSGHSHPVALGGSLDVSIPRLSFASITPFVTFDLRLGKGSDAASVSFVVNADLRGAPEDRHQRILSSMLDDRSKVLRYLLFLLSDPSTDRQLLDLMANGYGTTPLSENQVGLEVPLLEALLRALAHDPARLDPVSRLLQDLGSTEDGAANLPPGIADVWGSIWKARLGLPS